MNVLSLFDGMSCGQIALNRNNQKVDKYFACEIDKYAIEVTQHNYPNSKLPKIDLLIGGSPCQGFSFAGKMKGASTKCNKEITTLEQYLTLKESDFEFEGQSYLFWEYVRIYKSLREINPNIKFLLENVRMTTKWQSIIDEALDKQAVEISSSKVVPQKRKRLYWTNVPLGILHQKIYNISEYFSGKGFPSSCNISRYFSKKDIFNTLTATYYKGIRGSSRPAISTKEGFLDDDRNAHRMLTPTECEKLQTVPINYTECVSNTQRYKMLGNGMTVDVICYILKEV